MIQTRLSFEGGSPLPAFSEEFLKVPVPARTLGEVGALDLYLPADRLRQEGTCSAWDSGDLVAGWARGAASGNLEASVRDVYKDMFRLVGSRSLYRIWHFVPRINACEAGMENYRLFCRGRAEAFHRAYGNAGNSELPAASAVGSDEDALMMLFVGGEAAPRRAENPEQVPAYRYPACYGPSAPSFSRASRVSTGAYDVAFISGTASIKESETAHPGQCENQVITTLHNLGLISQSIGLGSDLGRGPDAARYFVIYLRHERDLERVRTVLEEKLFIPGDERVYLRADICRSDLMVEIESTIVTPRPAGRPPA